VTAGRLLARGAGLSTYVLLSAAVPLGLALPLRIASPSWRSAGCSCSG
jgi:hypothetical protein